MDAQGWRVGCGMWDAGCRLQAAGCRMWDAGCRKGGKLGAGGCIERGCLPRPPPAPSSPPLCMCMCMCMSSPPLCVCMCMCMSSPPLARAPLLPWAHAPVGVERREERVDELVVGLDLEDVTHRLAQLHLQGRAGMFHVHVQGRARACLQGRARERWRHGVAPRRGTTACLHGMSSRSRAQGLGQAGRRRRSPSRYSHPCSRPNRAQCP